MKTWFFAALTTLFLAFPVHAVTVSINGTPTACAVSTTADAITYICPIAKAPPPVTPPVATVCPVVANVVMLTLGPPNKGVSHSLARGQIASFPMPAPMPTGGYVQMVQDPGSPVSMDVEFWFSRCPGDVNDALRSQVGTNQWGASGKPCLKSYSYQGGPLYWSKAAGSITTCSLIDTSGPYYVNYRHNTCPNATCPMITQINVTTP